MTQLKQVHRDETLCITTWCNVVIMDVGGAMDAVRMRTMLDAYRTLIASYPKGVVALTLLRPHTPLGSPESRKESARITHELGDAVKCSAIVIEDSGVVAQMMRTVTRAIAVLSRNTRWTIAKDLDEAVQTLAPYIAAMPPRAADVAADLLDAVGQARKGYGR